jgi:hypothetical protein
VFALPSGSTQCVTAAIFKFMSLALVCCSGAFLRSGKLNTAAVQIMQTTCEFITTISSRDIAFPQDPSISGVRSPGSLFSYTYFVFETKTPNPLKMYAVEI